MMWRRRRSETQLERERALLGDRTIRAAEEIVSVAWINRLQFTADEDPAAKRLLKHERVVHVHAAARRSRASAADARKWAVLGIDPEAAPTPETRPG
jgi:hypothetical protein